MADPIDIELPLFSAAELANVAGLDRGRVDLWVHRGIICPSRVDRLTVRSRSSFSMIVVYEAKLIRDFGEHVGVGPTDAVKAAAAVIDDGKWLFHAARHAEAGDILDHFAIVSRSEDCWQANFHVGLDPVRAQKETPGILVATGATFAAVYKSCKALLSTTLPRKERKKARRARS